jgi:hypothetical protein
MSDRLEMIDGNNWRAFIAAPKAVLMIGKSDCGACGQWTEELKQFLETDEEWKDVRFGKMLLDQRGLISFKKENTWLADLDELPFNQIYVNGTRSKSFAGGGVERLVNRLRNLAGKPE